MTGNRSLWASLLVIGLAATAAGAGTFAQFSDTETSATNVIQAGTLDLQPEDAGSLLFDDLAAAPGIQVGTESVDLENGGSIDGHHVEVDVSGLTENDGPLAADDDVSAGNNLTAEAFASELHATTLRYDGQDLGIQLPGATEAEFDGDGQDVVVTEAADPVGTRGTVAHITSQGTSTNDYGVSMVDVSSQATDVQDVSTFSFDYYPTADDEGGNPDEIWIAVLDEDGNRHVLWNHENVAENTGEWNTFDGASLFDGSSSDHEEWHVLQADGSSKQVDVLNAFGDARIQAIGVAQGSPLTSATVSDVYFDDLTFESSTSDLPTDAPTLAALETYGLDKLGGLAADNAETKTFEVAFTLDKDVGNDYQDEGVAFEMTFTLNQGPEQ